jgi:hypothetical protein
MVYQKGTGPSVERKFRLAGFKTHPVYNSRQRLGHGKDKITGGTISVVSICEETAKLRDQHNAQTLMCTLNGDHLFLKHQMFENETMVFRFEQMAANFKGVKEVLIHLPEFLTEYWIPSLTHQDQRWFDQMNRVHVNIMNQNIQYMPSPETILSIRDWCDEVTITTAHQKYCTASYRQQFGVPIHKFSVWISPEGYQFRNWKDKQNLLVVSPDAHPLKEAVLQKLQNIPGLEIRIIKNLTYTEYKALIAKAKWSLTFGEGLDGYLIEPVFSGAIGFAVYNESFFTPDFSIFETIYPSYEKLSESICGDIERLDNASEFKPYQQEQFNLCAKYYSKEQYRKNIMSFYRGEYTFN